MEVRHKRKIVRSTIAQLKILVDYMAANPLFAAGEYSGPNGSQKLEEEWAALAMVLSNHGQQKSVDQWKHTWRDLKKRAMDDGSKVCQARNSTDNNVKVPRLSQQSQKILDILGLECAPGIDSVAGESDMDSMTLTDPNDVPMPIREIVLMPQPTPEPIRRLRRTRPQQRLSRMAKFIQTQEKANKILEDLRKEMRKNNEIQAAQLKVLEQIANTLSSPSNKNNDIQAAQLKVLQQIANTLNRSAEP